MKKRINYILLNILLIGMTACEKDLSPYDTKDCWIHFYFQNLDENVIFDENSPKSTYSFVYNNDKTTDTLWFEVETMGFVSDAPRPFELEQVKVDKNDAVAGVHYVSFDDPGLKNNFYFVPGSKARFQIPIVVKRDPSLKEKDVVLHVTFKENNEFHRGYEEYCTRIITISDRLTKPSQWNDICNVYFGTYGPVKHQFLIDSTKERWDDKYIEELLNGDSGYTAYLSNLIRRKLAELNQQRADQGLEALREEDGTLVEIPIVIM